MGLFTIEIVVHSLAQPNYFNSFFFWLDFVSTCSLIMDIGWFWDNVVGTTDTVDTAEQASQLARAGRGARLGSKAGRIMRVVRLIRLIRIVKLYKWQNTQVRAAAIKQGIKHQTDVNFDEVAQLTKIKQEKNE